MRTLLALAALGLSSQALAANYLMFTMSSYDGAIDAATARGDTWDEFECDSAGFAAAYAAGGYDAVIVDTPSCFPDATAWQAVIDATNDGVPVIIATWNYDGEPAVQTAMGVGVAADYSDEKSHTTASGASVDFFAGFGGTLVPSSTSWADNGDYLTLLSGGEIAGVDAAGGGDTIAITSAGIVNGFVSDNYPSTDGDGDGTLDMAELWDAELDYILGGAGGVNLRFTGACPGMITIDINGLTPGDSFAAARSGSLGSTAIPSGPCAGTTLGLAGPSLVGIFPTGSGTRTFMPSIGAGSCGDYVQIVDLATCATSNVAQF